jgi:hypothetical protein
MKMVCFKWNGLELIEKSELCPSGFQKKMKLLCGCSQPFWLDGYIHTQKSCFETALSIDLKYGISLYAE